MFRLGKDIFKSIFWPVYFFITQFIAVFVVVIIDIVRGKIDFSSMSNLDAYLAEVILPIMLIAGIFYILTFLIYKIIAKEKFDIGKTKFKELTFCTMGGFGYNLIITLLYAVIAAIFAALFGFANPVFSSSVDTLDTAMSEQSFLLTLLSTGIVVPIAEEIAFRYGICKHVAKHNRTLAIVLSSVIFGIAHGNIPQAIYTCVMALGMCVIYLKTDNLIYPIAIHMALNSLSVLYAQTNILALLIVGIIGLVTFLIMLFASKDCLGLFKLPPVVKKPQLQPTGSYPNQYGVPNQYGMPNQGYAPQVPNAHNPSMPYGYGASMPINSGYPNAHNPQRPYVQPSSQQGYQQPQTYQQPQMYRQPMPNGVFINQTNGNYNPNNIYPQQPFSTPSANMQQNNPALNMNGSYQNNQSHIQRNPSVMPPQNNQVPPTYRNQQVTITQHNLGNNPNNPNNGSPTGR